MPLIFRKTAEDLARSVAQSAEFEDVAIAADFVLTAVVAGAFWAGVHRAAVYVASIDGSTPFLGKAGAWLMVVLTCLVAAGYRAQTPDGGDDGPDGGEGGPVGGGGAA